MWWASPSGNSRSNLASFVAKPQLVSLSLSCAKKIMLGFFKMALNVGHQIPMFALISTVFRLFLLT